MIRNITLEIFPEQFHITFFIMDEVTPIDLWISTLDTPDDVICSLLKVAGDMLDRQGLLGKL